MKGLCLIFYLTVLGSVASCQNNKSHIIFQSNFSDNSYKQRWNNETPSAQSMVVTDSVSHKGKSVLKVVLNKTDALVSGSTRSELALPPDDKVQVERWVGVSMFLPKSFIADPEPESLLQWHDMPDLEDGGVWRSPPLALWVKNGRWILLVEWSAKKLSKNETLDGQKFIDLGPYQTQTWTDWVFHIRFSWQSNGLIELWKNGQKVVTYTGPNAYNDKKGNYIKLGIYKWMWAPEHRNKSNSNTLQRVVYYSNLTIGDEKASYKDVAP